MSTDITYYKSLYISSATNLVKNLNSELEILKSEFDSDSMERLHRNAHSLKGESLAMGYIQTGNLCKEIEHIASAIIERKIDMDKNLHLQISKSVDKLYESIKNIQNKDDEIDLTSNIESLKAVLDLDEKNSI